MAPMTAAHTAMAHAAAPGAASRFADPRSCDLRCSSITECCLHVAVMLAMTSAC